MKFNKITRKNLDKWEKEAIYRNLSIHNSHPFIKSEDKTQIIRPKKVGKDIYKTRQTHSEEVSIISEIISNNIGFKYPKQVRNTALLHDIGHPPFGHDGQKILDKIMKKYGLKEGFRDNNANFDVIFNNDIKVSEYELVSLIKHPKELYGSQKKMFKKSLKQALKLEEKEWGKKNYTMACMIMDVSDEISYSFSDFVDGYILGYTNLYVIKFLEEMIEFTNSKEIKKILKDILNNLLTYKSKRELRRLVNLLKINVVESVHYDYKKSKLSFKSNNKELKLKFSQFNYKYFIKNKEVIDNRKEECEIFEKYCEFIISNKYFTSDTYAKKHLELKTKKEQLKNFRNMIGDVTDNFVIKFVSKLK